MTTKRDGGPAFPQAAGEYIDHPVHGYIHRAQIGDYPEAGMTLRAYVAAKVLAQLAPRIVFPQSVEDQLHAAGVATADFEAFGAHLAVGFADALIARLEQAPEPGRFPSATKLEEAADALLAARDAKPVEPCGRCEGQDGWVDIDEIGEDFWVECPDCTTAPGKESVDGTR